MKYTAGIWYNKKDMIHNTDTQIHEYKCKLCPNTHALKKKKKKVTPANNCLTHATDGTDGMIYGYVLC